MAYTDIQMVARLSSLWLVTVEYGNECSREQNGQGAKGPVTEMSR